MPLLSFSDSNHVPLILDGRKAQTTRKPRKNPITVNDTLYVYFRSRMKKGTCLNCISKTCTKSNANTKNSLEDWGKDNDCEFWYNFIGTAKVTAVVRVGRTTLNIDKWDDREKESWAIADGFTNFDEADKWFKRIHGPDWQAQEWDIIHFEGDWLKKTSPNP
jgi:hypothetical protein